MSTSVDEIAAFVAVVEHGSFSGAAQRAGVSTGTLSKRLRALEARLQTQLLIRSTRKIALTQAGELFYDEVARIPRQLEQAEDRVREFAQKPQGRLKVVMPTYFASSGFHREVIPEYLEAHPDVRLTLSIVSDPTEHLGDDFDVLVAGKPPHGRFPDTSMIGRRLLKFQGALFAAPSYLDKHGWPTHPRDLARHNCISYMGRTWHFAEPDGTPIAVRVEGSLTTNSNAVLWAATCRGQGIAYSFPVFFAPEEKDGEIVRVLPEYTAGSYVDIHVFYPNARFVPQRTRAFVDALRHHFENDPIMTPDRP